MKPFEKRSSLIPLRSSSYERNAFPYETADFTSNTYYDFMNRHTWMMPASMGLVGEFIGTLKEFPRRQDPPSFDPSAAMRKLEESASNH